ncbi:MAG: tail fiber domain-containing protein, partial [Phycisphaerales bacterium]
LAVSSHNPGGLTNYCACQTDFNNVTVEGEVGIGTAFSYQGQLSDAGSAADGLYDFEYKLYDAPSGGNQLGDAVLVDNLDVIGGYFTVELDFGRSVFDGNDTWLEIGVRPGDIPIDIAGVLLGDSTGSFTTLDPRQQILPTPYAIYAQMTGTGTGPGGSDNDWLVSGNDMYAIPSGYVGIGTPIPSYTLDVNGPVNTTDVYKIGTDTVLSAPAIQNTFVGREAGASNVGRQPGASNDAGEYNTFLGYQSGWGNTYGDFNTSVGRRAGAANDSSDNTFIGDEAGELSTGSTNTYVGAKAGKESKSGEGNVFLGYKAGFNETGSYKLYIANSDADPPLIYGEFDTARVGIGTTSPATKMHVHGQSVWLTGGDAAGFSVPTGAGLRLFHTATEAHIWAHDYQNHESTNIIFQEHGGNVGIGTTDPGTYRLAVKGSAAKSVGGSSWATFSDARLKDIRGDYEAGLSEVCQLAPVRYSYKPDNDQDLPADGESVGVVAQQVQEVLPEAVEGNADGCLMVNNDPIIWAMVNAVKELKAENDTLKQRLEALERIVQPHQSGRLKEVWP